MKSKSNCGSCGDSGTDICSAIPIENIFCLDNLRLVFLERKIVEQGKCGIQGPVCIPREMTIDRFKEFIVDILGRINTYAKPIVDIENEDGSRTIYFNIIDDDGEVVDQTESFDIPPPVVDTDTVIGEASFDGTTLSLEIYDAITGEPTGDDPVTVDISGVVSYGTNDQVPFINDNNDGFEYKDGLKFDEGALGGKDILSATLLRTTGNGDGSQTLGNISTVRDNNTYLGDFLNLLGEDGTANVIIGSRNSLGDGANQVILIGENADVGAGGSIRIGASGDAPALQAITIGRDSINTGYASVVVGDAASTTASGGIAIGSLADVATDNDGIAIGGKSSVTGDGGIALGVGASSLSDSLALGRNAMADIENTIVFGAASDSATVVPGEFVRMYLGRGISSEDANIDPFVISATDGAGDGTATGSGGKNLILKGGFGSADDASSIHGTVILQYNMSSSISMNAWQVGKEQGDFESLIGGNGTIYKDSANVRYRTSVNPAGVLETITL